MIDNAEWWFIVSAVVMGIYMHKIVDGLLDLIFLSLREAAARLWTHLTRGS